MEFRQILFATSTALTLTLQLLSVPSLPANDAGPVVAVVERKIFTREDLDFWAFELRLGRPAEAERPLEAYHQAVLERAIDLFLLSGWAGMTLEQPTDDMLDAEYRGAIRVLEKYAGGPGRLRDALRDEGIDDQRFRLWLREREGQRILAQQAIANHADLGGASPSDGELTDSERIRIAHIFLPARRTEDQGTHERILRIRRDIERGVPFAEAARLYSEDRATSAEGGDLGWFRRGELSELLWNAAMETPRGAVSSPVRTPGGFHLITVLDFETPQHRQWRDRMREAERRQLTRLREESDIRLADGFTLREVEPTGGD